MKKLLLCIIFITLGLTVSAQTQRGIVRSIGRPGKPGQTLSNVTIQAKGMFNPVISDTTGEFSISIPGKNDGDALVFLRIRKNGFELKDKELIGRQLVCSSRVPIIIQMVDCAQLEADKKRIADNAYRVAEENYQKKLAELERQQQENEITATHFRNELQELQDKYDKYLSLVSDMADRYARTDYDQLDSIDYQINLCIENGELDKADSLIHTVFDPETVLERNRAAKREIEERIAIAQSIIDKAQADKEAILQDIEYAKKVASLSENLAQEYLLIDDKQHALDCLDKALKIKKILYGEESAEAMEIIQTIQTIKP
ncbi:MAG: hypothetical protein IJL44_02310 [Bacteroidales bacterium]|nr:hypothetical protein [Bacteroidales bacterium]